MSNEAALANRRGMESLRSGDAAAAAEHFNQACRADPAAAELWINLATAYRLLGDDERERSALEQTLAIDRRDLMALIRLAQLHERLAEEGPATNRWSDVLALASAIDQPAPELTALLAQARAYVERQRHQLAGLLDAALEPGLAGAAERDRRRVRAAADVMLGRRPVYANDCHGLHYPFLPADEFFDRGQFAWFDALEAATGTIRAELQAILAGRDPGLAPYVEQPSGVPENKWTPLDRSLDWGALHLWRDGERNEEACARAPQTAALVETLPLCRIPGRAPAVFFSILKAGAHIPPHTGVTNVRAIVHLPLIVPDGCTFRVGGETRAWVEGEAFAFDDTIEHEARNPTDRDRAVLILDTWNPHLSEAERRMICTLYQVTAPQHGPMRAD
ncbi:MAG TPA: aspartyl/asparaginyl beta-hydroxylase domain-containing protein [Sphingomicrobium sp.]|nr:aspartyl/asparaginyl beta-hydroxylase domain-containing protein [Sphingomicrobium sp.]